MTALVKRKQVLTHLEEWKDTLTNCAKPTGELHVAYLSQIVQSCHRLSMYFQNSINYIFITVTAIYSVQCLTGKVSGTELI
jgi:hypothetical protein